MASLTAELNLEISRFRAALIKAQDLLAHFSKRGDRDGRAYGRDWGRGFQSQMGGMLKKIALTLGAGSLAYALGSQFVKSMQDAASRERFEVGVAALTMDPTQGDDLFAYFREEAKRTGADLESILTNARRAIGQGMDPAETKQLMRSILDIQGSLALANHESELLVRGLLQVKSKGVAAMEELRQQIAEKGVPIFAALSEELGLEGKDLFAEITKGNVSPETVLGIFTNLTGAFERFRGGAEKMAQTVGGAWAVLGAEWRDLRIEFSEPMADVLRPVLREAAGLLAGMTDQAGAFGDRLAQAVGLAHAAIQELSMGEMADLLGEGLKLAFLTGVTVLEDGVAGVLRLLSDDGFWSVFETRFLAIAKAFATTALDGLLAALGIEGQKSYVRERVADPNSPTGYTHKFREMSAVETALSESDAAQVQVAEFWAAFRQFWADRDAELRDSQFAIEDIFQRLENRRIENAMDEQQRQVALKGGTGPDPAIAAEAQAKKDFHDWFIQRRLQFAADAAQFPVLHAQRVMQRDFGKPFAGAFGGAFTGVAGPGSNVAQVSLQDALDYARGDEDAIGEKLARQITLLDGINRTLGKIEQKKVPDIKVNTIPTFRGS